MSLAVVSRSLPRRTCGALRNDGVVGRFFSRQIWSSSSAARSPDSVARSQGAMGLSVPLGGLFRIFSKSAAPGSMWRSSLVVFSGVVSAIGGTLFLNAFNEVDMPALQQHTAKESKNVPAMNINSEEAINNDVEKAMDNDVEKAMKKEAAMKARFEAWMKEHNRRYWTRWEKARRYKFFKANAEFVDSRNEKLIKEGKPCSFGTNYFSDFSDEEWENYGTPAEDLVEFDKLFRSKSFVSLEDLRELNARLERKDKEKRSSGAWQIKHWLR